MDMPKFFRIWIRSRKSNIRSPLLCSAVSFLSVSFSGTQSATAKFIAFAELIQTICFADMAIFHVYLTQNYFESKYLKKL